MLKRPSYLRLNTMSAKATFKHHLSQVTFKVFRPKWWGYSLPLIKTTLTNGNNLMQSHLLKALTFQSGKKNWALLPYLLVSILSQSNSTVLKVTILFHWMSLTVNCTKTNGKSQLDQSPISIPLSLKTNTHNITIWFRHKKAIWSSFVTT